MHSSKKTKSLFIFMLAGFYFLSSSAFFSSDVYAEGLLKRKIADRRNSVGGERGLRDFSGDPETGGNSCAEKNQAINKLMNGRSGKRMYGPEADIEDISYGSKKLETLDVFYPAKSSAKRSELAPVIFMVHGGGWCIGSKDMRSVTESKVSRWTPKGFMFISVNYPMIMDGSMAVAQAESVAKALAYVQANAEKWGGDPDRIIMMGHSAGAHLVSLVNADSELRKRSGAKPVLGTVSLDSGAVNVPKQMPIAVDVLKNIYKEAFGTDKEGWIAASPYHQLDKHASPWLGVCSTTRPDNPCEQAEEYAEKSRALGIEAQVLKQKKGHGSINSNLGISGRYTRAVEKFMASLDPIVKDLLEN